jgi:hypothetical protein
VVSIFWIKFKNRAGRDWVQPTVVHWNNSGQPFIASGFFHFQVRFYSAAPFCPTAQAGGALHTVDGRSSKCKKAKVWRRYQELEKFLLSPFPYHFYSSADLSGLETKWIYHAHRVQIRIFTPLDCYFFSGGEITSHSSYSVAVRILVTKDSVQVV